MPSTAVRDQRKGKIMEYRRYRVGCGRFRIGRTRGESGSRMNRNLAGAAVAVVAATTGVLLPPAAHADPLDGVRSAVNGARSGSTCPALNYDFGLEREALLTAREQGATGSYAYDGKFVEFLGKGDPTAAAINAAIGKASGAIRDCTYTDFGVGWARYEDQEIVHVVIALGYGKAAKPPPEPADARDRLREYVSGLRSSSSPCPPIKFNYTLDQVANREADEFGRGVDNGLQLGGYQSDAAVFWIGEAGSMKEAQGHAIRFATRDIENCAYTELGVAPGRKQSNGNDVAVIVLADPAGA